MGELPLMGTAIVLTAFNDNAAITYLSTLVPGFTDGLKYAVVAGAVSGGGLTVIANAPNPAVGWSPDRAKALGRSTVEAMLAVAGDLPLSKG